MGTIWGCKSNWIANLLNERKQKWNFNKKDIKIGATTYGPDATDSKKNSEDSKYVGTKHPLGFSVLGMIVHPLTDESTNGLSAAGLLKLDRTFGLTLKANEISSVPEIFFDFKNRLSKFYCGCICWLFVKVYVTISIFNLIRSM